MGCPSRRQLAPLLGVYSRALTALAGRGVGAPPGSGRHTWAAGCASGSVCLLVHIVAALGPLVHQKPGVSLALAF